MIAGPVHDLKMQDLGIMSQIIEYDNEKVCDGGLLCIILLG
jgi:hypothetical protein